MGFLSKFENTMEDGIEGAAGAVGRSGITPVQITKKAEKQMKRERIVGAGKQYAPTLYTVLVSPEDDRRLFKYYPTLAGETETYLLAKAREHGYVMDGKPLVRFITDPDLKRGKFDVVAEMVAAAIVVQLREDEMERYGISDGRRRPGSSAAASAQRETPGAKQNAVGRGGQSNLQPLPHLQGAASDAGVSRDGLDVMADGSVVNQPHRRQIKPALESEPALISSGSREVGPAEKAENAVLRIDNIENVVRQARKIGRDMESGEQRSSDPPVVAVPALSEDLPPKRTKPTKGVGVDALFGGYSGAAQTGTAAGGVKVAKTTDLDGSLAGSSTSDLPEVYLYDEARDVAYQLSGAPQNIGRDSSNEIVVPDINISRVHAEIRREPNGTWAITDLGSTNGLYINGRKVRQAPLRDADMITLGTTTLEFQLLG